MTSTNPTPSEHEHKFEYQGMVYELSKYSRPGSGAHDVYYSHAYYCSGCLEMQYRKTSETHDSYDKIRHGAVPKPEATR